MFAGEIYTDFTRFLKKFQNISFESFKALAFKVFGLFLYSLHILKTSVVGGCVVINDFFFVIFSKTNLI